MCSSQDKVQLQLPGKEGRGGDDKRTPDNGEEGGQSQSISIRSAYSRTWIINTLEINNTVVILQKL